MRTCIVCLPSLISLSRVFAALALFFDVGLSPLFCLLWAVISDVLDGAVARYFKAETLVGRYIDPIADKVFALAFVYYLYIKNSFSCFQLVALFSRDISLIIFWLGLLIFGKVRQWHVRSFVLGKVMTSLQFVVFFLKIKDVEISTLFWSVLLVVGIGAFFELMWRFKRNLGEKIRTSDPLHPMQVR